MVDFYGLPQGQDRGWPGRAEASNASFETKANVVEAAISREIASEMGWQNSYEGRFVPFVVMHEFEALLFSDCSAFAVAIGRPALASNFQAMRNAFATPEEINDSPATAPSKRIASLVPGYQKPLLGTMAALQIGLSTIRAACPHFDTWMTLLESRSANG